MQKLQAITVVCTTLKLVKVPLFGICVQLVWLESMETINMVAVMSMSLEDE